eukprot:scaffold413945_cov14-Prasinocladus_malaysianus.AAC.1
MPNKKLSGRVNPMYEYSAKALNRFRTVSNRLLVTTDLAPFVGLHCWRWINDNISPVRQWCDMR